MDILTYPAPRFEGDRLPAAWRKAFRKALRKNDFFRKQALRNGEASDLDVAGMNDMKARSSMNKEEFVNEKFDRQFHAKVRCSRVYHTESREVS